jgi:tetratricopeptide (TPR) repeat protein
MKSIRIWVCCVGLGFAGQAWAEVDEDYESATFTGAKGAPVQADIDTIDPGAGTDTVMTNSLRLYPDAVYEGARVLNMDIKFVADCHAAIELVYQRKYSEAKAAFEAAQRRYPGSALGPIGHVLVYQALMLENLDFSYESQYTLAANQARQQLMEALEVRGNDAWEHFILGGVLGVDAIHSMRRGNYLTSLNRALEAMKSIERAKKLAPEFPDLKLGDGLYNYWRTVISRGVKGLPDFADNRMLGIEQLREVQENGIFLGPAATFALTYTWLEEGALKRATQSALRNHRAYPENVVNNLMLGRLYMYRRKYTESEKYFKMVVRVSPKNRRVHYFMTRMYLRQKRLVDAETSVNLFLEFDLSKRERALALMQKSLIYYRRADWDAENKVDAPPPPPPPPPSSTQPDSETSPSNPKEAKAAKAGRKR